MSNIVRNVGMTVVPTVLDNGSKVESHLDSSRYSYESEQIYESEIEMKTAVQNARKMVSDAEEGLDRAIKEAGEDGYEEGFDKGFKAGENSGRAKAMEKSRGVLDGINRFKNEFKGILDGVTLDQERFEDMIFELTEKIIDIELKRNKNAFEGLYSLAASNITRTSAAVLKVGGDGYEAAVNHLAGYRQKIDGLENLSVKQVPGGNGVCILETEAGTVDASVTTQLVRAREISKRKQWNKA